MKKDSKTAEKKTKEKKTPYSKEQYNFVYERFLYPEKDLGEGEKYNWPVQTRACQKLFKKYGVDFWPYVNLGFKIRSLHWLTHGRGEQMLNEAYRKFLQIQKPEKKIDSVEVVKYDRVTETKKSVKDTLFE